jgi:hypothetical protein
VKPNLSWITFLLFSFFTAYSISSAEEGAKSPAVGPGKAVLAASEEEGIRLSEKAKATIGLISIQLPANFQIPASALIHERGEFGVYVKRGDWFKYVEVEVENSSAPGVKIESPKIHVGDEIIVSGVSLLRLAELNLAGGGGDDD